MISFVASRQTPASRQGVAVQTCALCPSAGTAQRRSTRNSRGYRLRAPGYLPTATSCERRSSLREWSRLAFHIREGQTPDGRLTSHHPDPVLIRPVVVAVVQEAVRLERPLRISQRLAADT